jgi:cytochrome c556
MKSRILVKIAIGVLSVCSTGSYAAETPVGNQTLKLSPEVTELLRAEMREVAKGMQTLTLSLATADWKSIQETSAKIKASYIMEKKLTSAQTEELEKALPEQFKQLDAAFHQRAEKLGAAAAAHDAELAVFHYSRLIEGCTQCHSVYATKRLPGFGSPAAANHHH